MKSVANHSDNQNHAKRFQLKSIQSKIILLLLISVVLSSTLVGIICIANTTSILRSTAEDNMVLICDRGVESLNMQLEKIEEQVTTLKHYAETAFATPGFLNNGVLSEEERVHFLTEFETVGKNHAGSADGVIGVFALFNYTALGLDEPYGFSYKRGEHNSFTAIPLPELSTKESFPTWYEYPTKAKASLWLEVAPHANGKFEMSYVSPILLPNGVCIGVVGVSCETAFIEQASHDFKGFESGFAFVLNSDNSILYHPEVTEGSTNLKKRPEFKIIEENERAESAGVHLYSYRHEGDNRYLAASTLRNGKKLCISASQSEIYEWQSGLILSTVLLIIGAALLSILATVLFARSLTRPIKALNSAAREMLEGKLDTELIPTTADEIGELTRILNRARERIKFQINDLYDEAHHDGLTGVLNKTAFFDTERFLDQQIAYGTAAFVLAVLDVNRLKVTNDFHGHAAGDELLRAVAGQLKTVFDPQTIFRIGGDEFAVVLQGNNAEQDIAAIERCVARIPDIKLPRYPDITVSCSVGVTAFDKALDARFGDTMLRADHLMYRNKADSKRGAAENDGGKGIKQLQSEKYLEFLSILSQSTEDHLFLYEIENDKAHFFGRIFERYCVPHAEDGTLTYAQMTSAIHTADRAIFTETTNAIIDGKAEELSLNYRLFSQSGAPVWFSCRGRVIKSDGQPFLLIGRLSDTALRPFYSPVTGLFNRARFLQDMQAENTPSFKGCMLVDIDNMSGLNLKLGRHAGDELLRLLATTLEAVFPKCLIYHMEKDRFAILLDTEDADVITERFNALLSMLEGEITVSGAVVPKDDALYTDINTLYEYANQLLKENKSHKTGTLSFFTTEDFRKKVTSIALIDELWKSVANDFEGFYVVYQPQIATDGYTVAGAEALLRYHSPSLGVVSPAEFIPYLERTRLINKVGLFVCDTALRQCAAWRKTNPTFKMAVNFSTIQLMESETAEQVLALLSAHELPGDALTIELTESVQLESVEIAEAFERFRAEGICIAIDDFGTGYANLAYLKQIHADQIKIDRIFIKDIQVSSYNYMVIRNILDFAKQNGFHVCLEGVETAAELSILDELGADTLQGYLFDKPLSAEDFERLYIHTKTPEWGFTEELVRHKEQAHLIQIDTKGILSNIRVGLWVIRIDEAQESYKLFGDACMHDLLGIVDEHLSPEECYRHWYSRIKPGHEDVVNNMVSAMASGEKICQTLYPWMHPTLGEIVVRCTGKCVRNEDGVIVFEGFHRNVSEAGATYTNLTDQG